jgi:hypothetical protein
MCIQDSNNDATPTMLDMNFAVIGTPGSGKTSFMRKALGLPENTTSAQCHRKWTIDNTPYVVRFVEMLIDDIRMKPGNVIEWPKTANDAPVPRIDGAITIYDVTVKESLAGVPDMMSAYSPWRVKCVCCETTLTTFVGILSKAHVPFVLVACKCDQHPAHREVDPSVVEQKAKSFLGDVRVFQSSASSPDTQRECLTFMTKAVIAAKRREWPYFVSRTSKRGLSYYVRPSKHLHKKYVHAIDFAISSITSIYSTAKSELFGCAIHSQGHVAKTRTCQLRDLGAIPTWFDRRQGSSLQTKRCQQNLFQRRRITGIRFARDQRPRFGHSSKYHVRKAVRREWLHVRPASGPLTRAAYVEE